MTMKSRKKDTTAKSFKTAAVSIMGIMALTLCTLHTQAQLPDDYQRPEMMRGGVNIKPKVTQLTDEGDAIMLKWKGIGGPFQVQQLTDFISGEWSDLGDPVGGREVSVPKDQSHGIFRLTMDPNYIGSEACELCHSVSYNTWKDSAHAHGLESLKRIGRDKNGYCLNCHSTGFGQEKGYVSEEETPHMAGVHCEACHGPSGDHAANPFEVAPPVVELASEMCGGCHQGSHHGFYDEWQHSSHATATATLKTNSHAGDHCLECHSQDYRYAQMFDKPTPSVEQAKLSLECSTCHNPHGGTGEHALLRKPVAQLCGECHTTGESLLGKSPHHPQFDMLKGTGAFKEDGTPLNQIGPHTSLVLTEQFPDGKGCAQCHIVPVRPEQVDSGNPVRHGHTFNPFDETIPDHKANLQYEGCTLCHTTEWAEEHRHAVQGEIVALMEEIAPYVTRGSDMYIDPETVPEDQKTRFDVAVFNYKFVDADASHGVHNPANSKVALRTAKSILESLAAPDPEPEPETQE